MKPGDVVEVNVTGPWTTVSDPTWEQATVVDMLATQFTYELCHNKKHGFRFYAHKGDQWRETK